MLKKLVAALNPFSAKAARRPVTFEGALPAPKASHPHSFSCACAPCVEHTNELTRQRLKRQGA